MGKNNAMEGIVDKKASAAISLTSKESGISKLNGDSDVINKAIEDHLQEKENIEAVTKKPADEEDEIAKEPGEVEEELNEEEIGPMSNSPKEIPDKTDEAVLDGEKENGEHSEDKEETKEKSEDVMETEEKSEVEMETDEKSEVEMETDEKSEVEMEKGKNNAMEGIVDKK